MLRLVSDVILQKDQAAKKPPRKRRRDVDHFDSLVEQYKKKLMGSGDKDGVRRSKWFDG